MAKKHAVQKFVGDIGKQIQSPAFMKQLKMAAGRNFDIDQFLRVYLTVLQRNPTLSQCTQKSLFSCLFAGAQLQLSFQPEFGQAYMVPYKDKKKGVRIAQFICGYRGLIGLVHRSGLVSGVTADVVFEKDHFVMMKGLEPKLEHCPSEDTDRGKFRGAYCIIRKQNNDNDFDYMTAPQIMAIKNRSMARDSGPWQTDFEEMAKKTVVRRALKMVPMSVTDFRVAKAVSAENLFLDGADQSDLFLPESIEVVEQLETKDANEMGHYNVDREFETKFQEITSKYQGTDLLHTFLSTPMKADPSLTLTDVKKQALANPTSFKAGFAKFVELQTKQAKKPGRDPEQTGGQVHKKSPDISPKTGGQVDEKPVATSKPPYTARPDPMKNDATGPKQAEKKPGSTPDTTLDLLREIPSRLRGVPVYRTIVDLSEKYPVEFESSIVAMKHIDAVADMHDLVKMIEQATGIPADLVAGDDIPDGSADDPDDDDIFGQDPGPASDGFQPF